MKRFVLIAAGVLAVAGVCGPAAAEDSALGKCLVDNSTGKDREAFMKWMFLAVAANPSVTSMTNISDAQKAEINKGAATVMDRLILKDCHAESVEALRTGGASALENSFGTFGEIAMADLMRDPKVDAVLNGLAGYIDADGWEALGKEARAQKKPAT